MRVLLMSCMICWSGLAHAQDVGAESEAPTFNCDWPIEQVIDEIQRVAKIETYLCLHDREDAGGALLTRLQDGVSDSGERNRVSRSLALWMLGQSSARLFTAEEIHVLRADDKRLLEVGLRARKGKETSCSVLGLEISECNQGEVMKNLHWYRPIKNYNDRLLTEADWANREMIRNPPIAPEPEEGPEEIAVVESEATPPTEDGGCGCSAGALPISAGIAYLMPWWWARRRNEIQPNKANSQPI